jgi:rfaE bifunctional protein kinase chain/domain
MSRAIGETSPARLLDLLHQMASVSAAVLADLVLDEFRYGEPERVSREAPVLILKHRKTDWLPGGGANAIANLKSLGARPIPIGRLGDDPSGDALLKAFKTRGISSSLLWTPDHYQTPTKTRILAGGAHSVKQQVVRLDIGEICAMTPGEEEHLVTALRRALDSRAGLLISDYGYGMLHPGNIPGVLQLAGELGSRVVVDSRTQLGLYRGVTAAAPNLEEAEEAAGMTVGRDTRRLEEMGAKLCQELSLDSLLVTLGSRGMALFQRGAEPIHLPVFGTDEVADVTGAGDTVAAAFSAALFAGATSLEAAALANVAAGLVVLKRGTATVSPDELSRALKTFQ